ncbi:ABC transporter permease, partial [bacterium]|nr:ABC transporter permease [bacterium]
FAGDAAHSVVINRALADQQGWGEAVGQTIRYAGQTHTVIGVVENFIVFPFWEGVSPAMLGLADKETYRYLTVHVEDGETERVAQALGVLWDRHFPEVTFEYFEQTAVFEKHYESIEKLSFNLGYLAFVAVFISCMGLFGIAWQKVAERMKEIGVRKTLGASALHIIFLVNRSFLVILAISTSIATLLSYFGLSFLLSLAPGQIPLGLTPFILSNILVLLMAAVSLSTQTNKLLRVSPADVLRHE